MKEKLGTLHYNTRSEEGEVKWREGVNLTEPDVVMLDILKDWIGILTETYDNLCKITFPYDRENPDA